MAEISISQVIQETGIPASTLRYYEEFGLLSSTRRIGGRRQFDETVIQRLALIQTAQQAGFTLAELKILLNNVLESETGAIEWREMLERKLAEMDMRLQKIKSMRRLLEDITACDADDLAECIVVTGQRHQLELTKSDEE